MSQSNTRNNLTLIQIGDLKVGMYIILPKSWFSEHFAQNEFNIESQEQIEKISSAGFQEVLIDAGKSEQIKEESTEVKDWDSSLTVSSRFRETINDSKLPPEKKAEAVYTHSIDVMKNLFDDPKAENIQEVKNVVYDIVDLILADQETSRCLLNIPQHDLYTYTHSVNVGVLAITLAKAYFKDHTKHNMRELGVGFFLHDIGKVNVDAQIINKKGRLNEEEMGKMRSHSFEGYKVLATEQHLHDVSKVVVLQHHERADGSGYPRGLKGGQIHPYARICSIADVFDALTSERSYKKKLNPFDALMLMKKEMISHFQRDMFEAFVLLFTSLEKKEPEVQKAQVYAEGSS